MALIRLGVLALIIILCGCQVDVTPTPVSPRKITARKSVTKPAVKSMGLKQESSTVSVDLAWNPNPEENLAGYRLHYGIASGNYSVSPDVGNITQTTVQNLQTGVRYYFALTAYNTESFESPMSEEIEWISGEPNPTPTPEPIPTPTPSATPNPGNIVNISTRAFVQTNENVLIAGFVIADGPKKVLIRAIGPSLSVYFPLTLANPFLELRSNTGGLLDENDDWRDDQEGEIIATGLSPRNDRESAILRTLPAGSYTAIVRGVNNSTGVALVEVYALP